MSNGVVTKPVVNPEKVAAIKVSVKLLLLLFNFYYKCLF